MVEVAFGRPRPLASTWSAWARPVPLCGGVRRQLVYGGVAGTSVADDQGSDRPCSLRIRARCSSAWSASRVDRANGPGASCTGSTSTGTKSRIRRASWLRDSSFRCRSQPCSGAAEQARSPERAGTHLPVTSKHGAWTGTCLALPARARRVTAPAAPACGCGPTSRTEVSAACVLRP